MKILFIQTNYPKVLELLYKNNPNWHTYTYKKLMNIWVKELFSTSDFYSRNLRTFDWKGTDVVINDYNSQTIWAKEHNLEVKKINIPFIDKLPPRFRNTLFPEKWISEVLLAQIDYYKPDVAYIYNLSILNINTLKEIKKKVKLVVGQIASPLPLNSKILYEYDLLISSFPHFVTKFKNMGIKSEYLKWCFESSILNTISNNKKKYDVSYIGGFTPHHSKGNKVLEKLASNIKVDFWGYGENYLFPTSPIKKHFHGPAFGRQMFEIFSESKIVINRHINVAENYANNMRMFEATGMGALLVTEDKQNIGEFFQAGKEIITYKSADDLVNKVKYFLKNDKKRDSIAKNGQKRTLKDHTYKVRMGELDKILRKYL